MARPSLDIVIRFKDEEFWLNVLRKRFEYLTGAEIYLYGVDNDSSDYSREVFRSFKNPNLKHIEIANIEEYRPGASLNLGADMGKSSYILFLSAHCVPKEDDYLTKMINAIEEESQDCAGVFGRQLPLPCSGPQNTVDLALTYPKEDRAFRRTPMFNNASSIVRRSVYEKFKFHPEVTNLEDLIWAKEIHQSELYTKYTAEAEVYHYHGIHQHRLHSGNKRVSQSIDVLLDSGWLQIDTPDFCTIENVDFLHIAKDTSRVIQWDKSLQVVSSRSLDADESFEDFDYIIFSNESADDSSIAGVVSLALEQSSQFSLFQSGNAEHNLQQIHKATDLAEMIRTMSESIFVASKQVVRTLGILK